MFRSPKANLHRFENPWFSCCLVAVLLLPSLSIASESSSHVEPAPAATPTKVEAFVPLGVGTLRETPLGGHSSVARAIPTGGFSPKGQLGSQPLPNAVAFTLDPYNRSLLPGLFYIHVPNLLQGAAYDPSNNEVVVGDDGGNSLFFLNASTGEGVSAPASVANPTANAASPVGVAFDPSNGMVYAANAIPDTVTVIDPSTQRLVATIPVGCGPEHLAYDGFDDRMLVTNFCSANVSVINASTNQLLPINYSVGGNPTGIVWDPFDNQLFVACLGPEAILAMNATTGKILRQLSFNNGHANAFTLDIAFDPHNGYVYTANNGLNNVSAINGSSDRFVGNGTNLTASPQDLAFDPNSNSIYVAAYPSGVYIINDTTNNVTGPPLRTGYNPISIVDDPKDGIVYAADQGESTLTAINARNGTVLREYVPVAYDLHGDAFNPANGEVYVAAPDLGDACVRPGSVFAVSTGLRPSLLGESPVENGPATISVGTGSDRVFVPNSCSDTISVLNGSTNTRLPTSIPTGQDPYSIAVDPGTDLAAVTNSVSNNVTVFNTSSLAVVAPNVSVGVYPMGAAFTDRGALLLVTNWTGSCVNSVYTSNWTLAPGCIPVESGPDAMLYDPANGDVYVANQGSSSVSVINGTTGTVVDARLRVGSGPIALALDAQRDIVYVLNVYSGNISIIDGSTNTVEPTSIRVFQNSLGIAFDPTSGDLYVSNYVQGTIEIVTSMPLIQSANWTVSPDETGVPTTLSVSTSGGHFPLVYAYYGLPKGCVSVNSSALSCVPQQPGSYAVRVTVTDALGYSSNATTVLMVNESLGAWNLSASPSTIELGNATTFVASGSGGVAPISYLYTGLPAGCASTDASSFVCRPQASGTFLVEVQASDALNRTTTGFSMLTVVGDLLVSSFEAVPNSVRLGDPLALWAATTGGLAPAQFSYGGLPPGCATNNSPVISCTPLQAGSYTVSVLVIDAADHVATSTVSINVWAPKPAPLSVQQFVIFPSSVTLGQNVTAWTDWTGGDANASISYTGLPPGCTNETGRTTFICAPNATGTYNVTVTISDGAAGTVAASAGVSVVRSVPPSAPTPTAPAGIPVTDAALIAVIAFIGASLVAVLIARWSRKPRS